MFMKGILLPSNNCTFKFMFTSNETCAYYEHFFILFDSICKENNILFDQNIRSKKSIQILKR